MLLSSPWLLREFLPGRVQRELEKRIKEEIKYINQQNPQVINLGFSWRVGMCYSFPCRKNKCHRLIVIPKIVSFLEQPCKLARGRGLGPKIKWELSLNMYCMCSHRACPLCVFRASNSLWQMHIKNSDFSPFWFHFQWNGSLLISCRMCHTSPGITVRVCVCVLMRVFSYWLHAN